MKVITGLLVDKVLQGDMDLLEAQDKIRDFDFPPGVDREEELRQFEAAVKSRDWEAVKCLDWAADSPRGGAGPHSSCRWFPCRNTARWDCCGEPPPA